MGKSGKREFVQVLRLMEVFKIEDVAAAVRDAIARGAIGFDAVKHLVLCRIERRPPRLDMTIYPYLPKAMVATTSARRARATSRSGSAWRHARRVYRLASSRRRLWSTNCSFMARQKPPSMRDPCTLKSLRWGGRGLHSAQPGDCQAKTERSEK